MHVQARLPLALCAIHNFIRCYNPDDMFDLGIDLDDQHLPANDGDDEYPSGPPAGFGEGPADRAERRRADERRDNIAQEMWIDYQEELARRGLL
jgi:hypothetical protein